MKDLRSSKGEKETDLSVTTLVQELQQRGIMPSQKPLADRDA